MNASYTYLREFHIEPAQQAEFERQYGPRGAWASLFRRSPGYIETILLQDQANPLRYITIDRWRNVDAYRSFRAEFFRQYDELDQKFQSLTRYETWLGEFSEPVGNTPR